MNDELDADSPDTLYDSYKEPAAISMLGLPELVTGEVAAKAIVAVWDDVPVTKISAPPGAGKTDAVIKISSYIAGLAGLSVLVVTTSYKQLFEAATRFQKSCPEIPFTVMVSENREVPDGLEGVVSWKEADAGGVTFCVAAKLLMSRSDVSHLTDVIIVDEAWQITAARLREIKTFTPQIVLVGDPGQIPPIFKSDVSRWSNTSGPHVAGPEVLATEAANNVTEIRFGFTRRCGPVTTNILQPLYPFQFGSERYPSTLAVNNQKLLEVDVLPIDDVSSPIESRLIDTLVGTAKLLTEGTNSVTIGNEIVVTPATVAIVVSRIAQVAAIQSQLAADPELSTRIVVDTANRLQGTEYDAVVAADPLLGELISADNAVEPGRLCVALSRHRSHLCWVTSNDIMLRLAAAIRNDPTQHKLVTNLKIRERIMAASTIGAIK